MTLSAQDAGISSLPEEIVSAIFQHLDISDVLHVALTCRRWAAIVRDDWFWKTMFMREWSHVDTSAGFGSGRWKLHVRDWATFPQELLYHLPQHNEVWHVSWSADGRYLTSCGRYGRCAVWDATMAGCPRLVAEVGDYHPISYASLSMDGTRLVTCSQNSRMTVWSAADDWSELVVFSHLPGSFACWWPRSSERLVSGVTVGPAVGVWDVDTHQLVSQYAARRDASHIQVTPDARTVAWRQLTCELATLQANDPVHCEAVLCDVETGTQSALWHDGYVVALRISPCGTYMVTGVQGAKQVPDATLPQYMYMQPSPSLHLQLWDLRTRAAVLQCTPATIQHPDVCELYAEFGGAHRDFLMCGTNTGTHVWHRDSGALVTTIANTPTALSCFNNAVAWHPNNRSYAVASDDGSVHVYGRRRDRDRPLGE